MSEKSIDFDKVSKKMADEVKRMMEKHLAEGKKDDASVMIWAVANLTEENDKFQKKIEGYKAERAAIVRQCEYLRNTLKRMLSATEDDLPFVKNQIEQLLALVGNMEQYAELELNQKKKLAENRATSLYKALSDAGFTNVGFDYATPLGEAQIIVKLMGRIEALFWLKQGRWYGTMRYPDMDSESGLGGFTDTEVVESLRRAIANCDYCKANGITDPDQMGGFCHGCNPAQAKLDELESRVLSIVWALQDPRVDDVEREFAPEDIGEALEALVQKGLVVLCEGYVQLTCEGEEYFTAMTQRLAGNR